MLEFPTLPHVALAAAAAGTRLVHVSSDAVFSGTAPSYDETHPPDPVTPYGVGLVHLWRLNDSQVWRRHHGDRPAASGAGGRAVAVSCRAVHPPSAGACRDDRGRVTLRGSARYRP